MSDQSLCIQPLPGMNSRLPELDLQLVMPNTTTANKINAQIFLMRKL